MCRLKLIIVKEWVVWEVIILKLSVQKVFHCNQYMNRFDITKVCIYM